MAKLCECGNGPAAVAGFCRACWAAMPVEARTKALRTAHPESFRLPNRRLEWRAR